MIHEILLYDDCSTIDELNAPLERHIAAYPKVRLVRSKERGGLVKARMFAARSVLLTHSLTLCVPSIGPFTLPIKGDK